MRHIFEKKYLTLGTISELLTISEANKVRYQSPFEKAFYKVTGKAKRKCVRYDLSIKRLMRSAEYSMKKGREDDEKD